MEKIKLALLNAPSRYFEEGYHYPFGKPNPPNGIRVIGGHLLEKGLVSDVHIFDGAMFDSSAKFLSSIEEYAPEVIGVPCYTSNIPEIRHILKRTQARMKIAGGPYATARPAELLESCDAVFLGESEKALEQFFRRIETAGLDNVRSHLETIPGIASLNPNGNLVKNDFEMYDDLNQISFQGWKLVADYLGYIKVSDYLHLNENLVNILSSRGCQNHCVFCSSNQMHRRGFRFRSPSNISEEIAFVNELRIAKGLGKLDSLVLDDDDIFARDFKELEELFHVFKNYGLTFSGMASINNASAEKIKMAARLGLKSVFFGIETHEGKRRRLGKGMFNDARVKDIADLCSESGVFTSAGYIIGFPWESREDIEKTIESMQIIPIDYPMLRVLCPHPGTPLWESQMKKCVADVDFYTANSLPVDVRAYPLEPEGVPSAHPLFSKLELNLFKIKGYERCYSDTSRLERLAKKNKTEFDGRKMLGAFRDVQLYIEGERKKCQISY